jgi:hypothetical protein
MSLHSHDMPWAYGPQTDDDWHAEEARQEAATARAQRWARERARLAGEPAPDAEDAHAETPAAVLWTCGCGILGFEPTCPACDPERI